MYSPLFGYCGRCRAQGRSALQPASVEWFCTVCKSGCCEADATGASASCLADRTHAVVASLRCKCTTPAKCGAFAAGTNDQFALSCVPPRQGGDDADACLICGEDASREKACIVFAPCGHALCRDCFPMCVESEIRAAGLATAQAHDAESGSDVDVRIAQKLARDPATGTLCWTCPECRRVRAQVVGGARRPPAPGAAPSRVAAPAAAPASPRAAVRALVADNAALGTIPLQALKLLEKDAYSRVKGMATRIALRSEEGFLICTSCASEISVAPARAGAVRARSSNRIVQCPRCRAESCAECYAAAATCRHALRGGHPLGHLCDAIAQRVLPACPRPTCRTRATKDGACNHVHCPHCGLDYCFMCSRPQRECKAHPGITFVDRILARDMQRLGLVPGRQARGGAFDWEHLLYYVRALLILDAFITGLRQQPHGAAAVEALMASGDCPLVRVLSERVLPNFEAGPIGQRIAQRVATSSNVGNNVGTEAGLAPPPPPPPGVAPRPTTLRRATWDAVLADVADAGRLVQTHFGDGWAQDLSQVE
jgi:hypothetical protein